MLVIINIIHQILYYSGVVILCFIFALLGGIVVVWLLAGIMKLTARPRSKFLQRAFQIIPASLESLSIVATGLFIGASIGTVIESTFDIPTVTFDSTAMGFLLSGVCAFSVITTKWDHCYLNEHDYAQVLDLDGVIYPYDACTRCRKHSPD